MATVTRYEFMGNRWYFLVTFLSGILLPFAILYLINSTIRIDEQVDDGEALARYLRARR